MPSKRGNRGPGHSPSAHRARSLKTAAAKKITQNSDRGNDAGCVVDPPPAAKLGWPFAARVRQFNDNCLEGKYTEEEKAGIAQMLFAEQYETARVKIGDYAPAVVDPPERKRLIEGDSAMRKSFPMATGLLDYFPDALAAVAEVSYQGNQKHNPGEPMHHARGKSMDHPDCIARHLTERGGFDGGIRHSAALAWRALALLQEELETEMGLPLPRAARA